MDNDAEKEKKKAVLSALAAKLKIMMMEGLGDTAEYEKLAEGYMLLAGDLVEENILDDLHPNSD